MADTVETSAGEQSAEIVAEPGMRIPGRAEINAAQKLMRSIKAQEREEKGVLIGFARDRRMAANKVGNFEVAVPIAQSYVDVLRSFLYARDPEVAVDPAPATEPPPERAILAMARKKVSVQVQEHLQQNPGEQPNQQAFQQAVQRAAHDIMAPFLEARDDAEQLASTIEIVVQLLWQRASLKAQAKLQVNSALTIGLGWIKCVWLERSKRDPLVDQQIQDLQGSIAGITAMQQDINESAPEDTDARKAQLQQQIQGLEGQVNKIVDRGLVIDFMAAEDITIGPCRGAWDYLNAPWIRGKHYLQISECKARWTDLGKRLNQATTYRPKRPPDPSEQGDNQVNSAAISEDEATNFTSSQMGQAGGDGEDLDDLYVCVSEIYDRTDGTIKTMIEGVSGYVEEPKAPAYPTTRFYPFFLILIGLVDGERWPRSLITRSTKLFNEYNAVRSNLREHRRRTLPKTVFDRTNLTPADATKIEGGGLQEMIGIAPVRPGTPVGNMVQSLTYAHVDPALYDTSPIRADLELVWGIQEALASSIQTPKTATEAEIQNQGTESRTGYMREAIDDCYGELAQYVAEIAINAMSPDDVRAIAGDWALWPQGMELDKLHSLVQVDIRAGSSGKPNTSAQQQAWAQLLPMLQNAIKEVGQLRNSSPDEMADSIDELMRETFKRMGERADTTRFLPQAADPASPPPAKPNPPIADVSLTGPQLLALTAVVNDVRTAVMSAEEAKPLVIAAFPTMDEQLIQAMIDAAAKQAATVPTPPATDGTTTTPQGAQPAAQAA